MDLVTLYHPDLPDQPITVPESAVPHHASSGWRLDKPQPPPDPEPEPEPEPGADDPPPTKKAAAKKTTKKGD